MKKFAFTLAEVLITLTIIGVISAMVLPNMLGHWEKKALETQTKHFYSMFSLALHNYMADNHVDDLSDTPLYCEAYEREGNYCERAEQEINNFVMKYLKVAIKCDNFPESRASSENKCYSNAPWKGINKNAEYASSYSPTHVLAHGYAIDIRSGWENKPLMLIVDVNGQAGPNRGGRDIWWLYVYDNGTITDIDLTPECEKDTECIKNETEREFNNCLSSYWGRGCFAHFKDNGFKFDY